MNKFVYLALLVCCCLYALARGGTPERTAVGILITAVVASAFTGGGAHRFYQLQVGLLAVDTCLFLAMTTLALKAQRYWPMWLAAVKFNTVITHLLILSPTLPPWSYAVANAAWSYPSPLLIAIGAIRHRRRLRTYGTDPAWS